MPMPMPMSMSMSMPTCACASRARVCHALAGSAAAAAVGRRTSARSRPWLPLWLQGDAHGGPRTKCGTAQLPRCVWLVACGVGCVWLVACGWLRVVGCVWLVACSWLRVACRAAHRAEPVPACPVHRSTCAVRCHAAPYCPAMPAAYSIPRSPLRRVTPYRPAMPAALPLA
eukprot:3305853-Prymnesium_polylepis.2